MKIRFLGLGGQGEGFWNGPFEGDHAFMFVHISFFMVPFSPFFKYISLLALVSEFHF